MMRRLVEEFACSKVGLPYICVTTGGNSETKDTFTGCSHVVPSTTTVQQKSSQAAKTRYDTLDKTGMGHK